MPHPPQREALAERPAPERAADLAAVGDRLARLTHDLNNPLAIIAGNAQFALELARGMELDPDLKQSLRDIEEASHRVVAVVDEIVRLKEELEAVTDEGRVPEEGGGAG